MIYRRLVRLIGPIVGLAVACQLAQGQVAQTLADPARFLPPETRAYLATPDATQLRDAFRSTDLGRLSQEPLMQPFIEDLKKQLSQRASDLQGRLGVTLEDLWNVQAGAMVSAAIELAEDREQSYAFALLIDTTGKEQQRTELLEKVRASMTERRATAGAQQVGPTTVTTYTLPREPGQRRTERIVLFAHEGWLTATNHPEASRQILARLQQPNSPSLAQVASYQQVQVRAEQAVGEGPVHLRWFVEPFGYVRILRAADPTLGRREWAKKLSNQGFTAIQGIGGAVRFGLGSYDVVHATFIHAPGASDPANQFQLAARMLAFTNEPAIEVPAWIPRNIAGFGRLSLRMQQAFEFSETLVDEIAGQEGFFDDFIDSIKVDPFGPQIDIPKDLVAYLGDRALILTDHVMPITPQSERLMVALEVSDGQAVAQTLQRALENDPEARRVVKGEHTIWEIVNATADDIDAPQVQVPGFDPLGAAEEEEEPERLFPNSAITVAHGHLIWTNRIDFMDKVLEVLPPQEQLATAPEFERVREALRELGAGNDTYRAFTRTAEAYRPTFELLKEGKMPESETLLGRLLNRILGPEEGGALREQKIRAESLPDFEQVREFFGLSGAFARTQNDGWLVVGCLLPVSERSQEAASVRTASAPRDE